MQKDMEPPTVEVIKRRKGVYKTAIVLDKKKVHKLTKERPYPNVDSQVKIEEVFEPNLMEKQPQLIGLLDQTL